ncbi:uncharacterized protein V1513DRAFT_164868 [Lipomyces chichibuensis]|uniref:uncharacterized protein n=1 Tax=Lipomyces chichibuensis TaxID=1546026 RepID=UPI003343E049
MNSPSLNEYIDNRHDSVSSNRDADSTLSPMPWRPLPKSSTQKKADRTCNDESGYHDCESRMTLVNGLYDLDDIEENGSSNATEHIHSPVVSDDLSSSVLSPSVISIVRAALDIPLSPMTARRKKVIVDAIIPKNIPTTIFHEMAAVYVRRAEILSKGFNLKYLTPVGKQRNRGRPKGHVKRPLNSFMIYRRVQTYLFHASPPETCEDETGCIIKYESSVLGDLERINHQSVSVIIGQFWRTESQIVRDAFTNLAKQESSLHRELHPDYKYCPQKKKSRSPRILSSGSALSRSHKPSKLSTTCQPVRFILPSTDRPNLIKQGDLHDYYSLETGLLTATSNSSSIFTPGMSTEESILPATLDGVWTTISTYNWSDASSTPSPDYTCMERISLSSSPSEEPNFQNHPALRIPEDYCGTEEQCIGTDGVQIDTSLARPSDTGSPPPIIYLQRTRTSYSFNAIGGSGHQGMDEATTNFPERVVTNTPSLVQHLIGSANGLQDMVLEASGYDDIEQTFKTGFNMWAGNNCCLELCN